MPISHCPSCQSANIIPNAVLHEWESRGQRLMVTVNSKPKAVFLKGAVDIWVNCAVCGNCGYLMLYAEDPQALWDAYQAQQKS